jgi:hypothetical protein
MWPWRTVRSQVAHRGNEPRPGAQLAGGGEAADVAELGQQRHRGDPPDPGQGHERADARIGLGASAQVALHPGHHGVDGVDERQPVVDQGALDGRQVQGCQPGSAAG